MKYPIKYKGEKAVLKFPVEESIKKWYVHRLNKDGTTERNGTASYEKEEYCARPCLAHNYRVGYSDKDVKKFIKKYYHVKKAKKQKSKKGKKNKT